MIQEYITYELDMLSYGFLCFIPLIAFVAIMAYIESKKIGAVCDEMTRRGIVDGSNKAEMRALMSEVFFHHTVGGSISYVLVLLFRINLLVSIGFLTIFYIGDKVWQFF